MVLAHSFSRNFSMSLAMATKSLNCWHWIHYLEYSSDKGLGFLAHGSLHRPALMTWQLPAPRVRTQTKKSQRQAAMFSVAYCWDSHTLDSPLVTGQFLEQKRGLATCKDQEVETSNHWRLHIVAPRHLQR